jgi:hypothetical protein
MSHFQVTTTLKLVFFCVEALLFLQKNNLNYVILFYLFIEMVLIKKIKPSINNKPERERGALKNNYFA